MQLVSPALHPVPGGAAGGSSSTIAGATATGSSSGSATGDFSPPTNGSAMQNGTASSPTLSLSTSSSTLSSTSGASGRTARPASSDAQSAGIAAGVDDQSAAAPGSSSGPGTAAQSTHRRVSSSVSSSAGGTRSRRPSTPRTPPSPPARTSSLRPSSHVQAIHDFDPSIMPTNQSLTHNMYLSFRAGEIIRVHGRDPSGWWDGEVMSPRPEDDDRRIRRGWFPSNYVREVDVDEQPYPRRSESSRNSHRQSSESAISSPGQTPRGAVLHSEGVVRNIRHTHASHPSTASHVSHHSSQHSHSSTASHHVRASQIPQRGSTDSTLGAPLSPALQTLLQPVQQSLSLLQSSIQSRRRLHIQPSAAQVISAIRTALLRMDCLSKESKTLAAHPVLAKERRYVLAELSKLVACAKLAGTENVDEESDDNGALESTGKAARSVFASVRRFLLHASEAGVSVAPLEVDSATEVSAAAAEHSPTAVTNHPSRMRVRTMSGAGSRIPLKSASVNDLRTAARRQAEPAPPLPTSQSAGSGQGSRAGEDAFSPSLGSSSGRSSPVSVRSRRRASSHTRHARSASFDMAPVDNGSPELETNPNTYVEDGDPHIKHYVSGYAIHQAIAVTEDTLVGVIASFLGHIHSHDIGSHPSSHAYMIELTRETVDGVRDLLTIVEAVGRQAGMLGLSPREVNSLKIARDDLYDAASNLVEAAETVANVPFEAKNKEQVLRYEEEKDNLMHATTSTLRASTECTRVVRLCVPQEAGEPEFDSPNLSVGHGSPSLMSPRQGYAGLGLGIKGPGSLQSLARRATSLNHLHKRYQQDSVRVSAQSKRAEDTEDDDDDEEVVDSTDEDTTMRGGHSARPNSHPSPASATPEPHDGTRRSSDVTFQSRSRSTSLSTPVASKVGHKDSRSPSRSVDLTHDFDLPVRTHSRQGHEKRASARSSTLVSFGGSSAQTRTSQSQMSSPMPVGGETQTHGLPDTPISLNSAFPSPSIVNGSEFPMEGGKVVNFTPPTGPTPARPAPPHRSPALPPPGEEQEGGDVRFWVVAHDYDPREVAYNSDGTLVGGTLRVLVEKLTPHDGPPDLHFAAVFWYTFRLFTTPEELLDTFIARFNLTPPPVVSGMGEAQLAVWVERKLMPVRLRVYNSIKTWVDLHWRPASDDLVLEKLEKFSEEVMLPTIPKMSTRLVETIKERRQFVSIPSSGATTPGTRPSSIDRMRNSAITSMIQGAPSGIGQPPTPTIKGTLLSALSRNPPPTNVPITDFDTLELARQLTIMESKLFADVAPEDLLMTGKKAIPALKALSTMSNQITGWVADGILNEQDAKHRAALVKFYIKLADKCLQLNNFSTLWAVMAGLNSSTILRLKKTWDVLSTKHRLNMDRLRGVIEHTKNHAAYRARLREVTGPCLPFLGLILSDITFTQDGNPNSRPSTLSPELQLVNQDKFAKLGRIAIDFRKYQVPFDLKELEPVQAFLKRVLTERGSGSLEALYRKSLLLEPRQGSERFSSAVEKPGWLRAQLQV
ncbi:Ras guanine nucleotide exchange factor bud5 [Vanrija albida]|uniref:Ras guanine nucleotide exchange factor bud5 n=1 Tax=Vanrija albida TaxID=181172 RepID=A0ABR3Q6Z6_9TREE